MLRWVTRFIKDGLAFEHWGNVYYGKLYSVMSQTWREGDSDCILNWGKLLRVDW